MRNLITNNYGIKIDGYRNAELENYIDKEHKRIVEEVAIPIAREQGEINQPDPNDTKGNSHFRIIRSKYQRIVHYAKTKIQAEADYFHTTEKEKQDDEEQVQITQDLYLVNEKNRKKKADIERFDQYLISKDKKWIWLKFWKAIIIFADIGFSAAAFESMGFTLLIAIAVGIGFGVVIYFCSDIIPNIIRKGKTKSQRISITVLFFLILAVVFYFLGTLRTLRFNQDPELFGLGLNPFVFMILNLFFFAVATAITFYGKPTKEEIKKIQELNVKQKELKEFKNEKLRLEKESQKRRDNKVNNRVSSAQIMLYATNIEAYILTLYSEAYETYVTTNLTNRLDRLVPVCFDEGPPLVQTYYQRN